MASPRPLTDSLQSQLTMCNPATSVTSAPDGLETVPEPIGDGGPATGQTALTLAETSATTLRESQIEFLHAARELPMGATIKSICEAINLPSRTFYGWLREPLFSAAYDRLWYEQVKDNMPEVSAAMIRQAKRGDVKAAKLLFDALGLIVRQSHEDKVVRVIVERE